LSTSRTAALVCLLGLGPALAAGQTPDAASERARLGNERIQAEAERRMREEHEQQDAGPVVRGESAGEPARPAGAPASSAVTEPKRSDSPPPRSGSSAVAAGSVAPRGPPATDDELTERALKQLRDLGELKDTGYVTDEEFRRIKERILERRF
jgi:hypothetical protein